MVELVVDMLNKCSLMMVFVEFCMGGLVVVVIIDVLGLFVWFECGFVVYFNEVKL